MAVSTVLTLPAAVNSVFDDASCLQNFERGCQTYFYVTRNLLLFDAQTAMPPLLGNLFFL